MSENTPHILDIANKKSEKPWYCGHRARMTKRIKEKGVASLTEDELLEQILMRALPRRDVKPIVRSLMAEYKTLSGVLSAPFSELTKIKGISENSAIFFAVIRIVAQKLALGAIKDQPILSDWERLLDYINALYAGELVEVLYILYLDSKLGLIKAQKEQIGSINHIPITPRDILKRALDENASKLILVHNHPSGDSQPSLDDIRATESIAKLLAYSDIELIDHLIIGRNRHLHSMRAQGILEPFQKNHRFHTK